MVFKVLRISAAVRGFHFYKNVWKPKEEVFMGSFIDDKHQNDPIDESSDASTSNVRHQVRQEKGKNKEATGSKRKNHDIREMFLNAAKAEEKQEANRSVDIVIEIAHIDSHFL